MATPTSNTLPLADIHLQAAPGLWPLAWGWWALLAALALIIVAVVYALRLRTQKRKAQKEAIKQLCDTKTLGDINALLKRAALTYFPRHDVAKLTGHMWLTFLDNQLPVSKRGFVANETLWQKGVFSKEGLNSKELDICKALAKVWLTKALPPKKANLPQSEVKDV
ncbi:DUF4381 domain-containing protein [Enterovibrio sp. ZSDZ35]|uniref:DUF4381 domain-containing protein n=1 Tax=Enterovibrio qingdaonensis TaxID=2899818 RepID=A0ABT5QKB1_9GAMM|nr:DUF4381 domain-containing protein [Enterovibrio sp. ZSDZ35]MDD1781423.1 DUF4381 domain-containing protein [Enterovibrio sp. ZSDZ35]